MDYSVLETNEVEVEMEGGSVVVEVESGSVVSHVPGKRSLVLVRSVASHCATVLITMVVLTGERDVSPLILIWSISVLLLSFEVTRSREASLAGQVSRQVVTDWGGEKEFLHDNKPDPVKPGTEINVQVKRKTQTPDTELDNTLAASVTHCCERVSVSSSGVTSVWYPHMLGVYTLLNHPHQHLSPLYKMSNTDLFLSRPSRGGKNFTWGINPDPDLTWGWARAVLPGTCPDNVLSWAAFDKKNKRMTPDKTLLVSCLK